MRKALKVGMLSAGFLLIGSSAQAADNWSTFGNAGIGNGNQVKAPIQVPVEVCGNAIGIGGPANAWCQGGASAVMGAGPELSWFSSGNAGVLNGNQVSVPVQAPINVCGNAIAVLGSASAGCAGGSSAVIGDKPHSNPPNGYRADRPARSTAKPTGKIVNKSTAKNKKTEVLGLEGLTGGLPLGGLLAGLTGGAPAHTLPAAVGADIARYPGGGHGGSCDLNWFSSGNIGLLNGNQVYVPVQAPIDISGNAIGVLGSASAGSMGGSHAKFC